MNKLLYLFGLSILMFVFNAHAVDSTITISGNVRDSTCSVEPESKDITVNLMNNPAKQFSDVGSTSPFVPFNIVLSNCGSSITAVKVGFSGLQDSENSNLLQIDGGGADGVGIQILNNKKEVIPINSPPSSLQWNILGPGQLHILEFYARLMATHVPVTAGHVSANAIFTLEFQ